MRRAGITVPMPDAPVLLAGRYRLGESLGRGGMGQVLLARDETLERDVAIKELYQPLGGDDAASARRTIREARAAARISHPNVVQVYDVLQLEDRTWIVMEYVRCRSLREEILEQGPLDPYRVARIGLDLLGALRTAHRLGVEHRDVKPANVLLADDGRVLLTDFGIAAVDDDGVISRSDILVGSPQFMAPERAQHGASGPAADLWSLGATLYAAVEGHAPYQRGSTMATLTALTTEEPDPPQQAGAVRPLLDGLLRKDPATRMTAEDAEALARSIITGLSGDEEDEPTAKPGPGGLAGFVASLPAAFRIPRPRSSGAPSRSAPGDSPAVAPPDKDADVPSTGTPSGAAVDDRSDGVPPALAASAAAGVAGDVPELGPSPDAATADPAEDSSAGPAPVSSDADPSVGAAPVSRDADSSAGTAPVFRDGKSPAGVASGALNGDSPAGVGTGSREEGSPVTVAAGPRDDDAPVTVVAGSGSANLPGDAGDSGDSEEHASAAGLPGDVGTGTVASGTGTVASGAGIEPVPAATPAARGRSVVPGQRRPGTSDDRAAGALTGSDHSRRRLAVVAAALAVVIAAGTAWVLSTGDGNSPEAQPTPTPTTVTTPAGSVASQQAAPPADAAQAPPSAAPSAGQSANAGPSPDASPSSGTSAGTSPSAPARPERPAGWVEHKDPTGFSVYVPEGWKRSKKGTMVYFRGDGKVLGVDQTDKPKADPVADWKAQRDYRRSEGDWPGYKELKLDLVPYFRIAADWEFTFDGSSGRRHVNNRGAVISDKKAYGFYWETSDGEWNDSRDDLQLVFDSFVPAKS